MAPEAADAEKAIAKGQGEKKGKREKKEKRSDYKKKGKRGSETYKLYLYKVLKEVHPESGISSQAMTIMNEFMIDIFDRLAREASQLALKCKKPTLGSREIETALKLVVPGDLAKHAAREGAKAIAKYWDNNKKM